MADDGPRLEDPGVIAQRLYGQGSSGNDDDKNHFENIADGLVSLIARFMGKIGLPKIRLRTLLSTGFLKQFTPTQAWSSKTINEPAQTMTARGGTLANIAKVVYKPPEFNNIAKPPIEGFPVQAMSYAALGNLVPLNTPSGGMDRGSIQV